ncbi:MAG: hypothetical protein WBV46_05510 [Terriglobales bacterium]|jgi:hypothetical protein
MAAIDGKGDLRDDDLRERFGALRREEEARAPAFAMPSVGRFDRSLWRSAGPLLAVAASVLAILALILWTRTVTWRLEQERNVASITGWKAPTDFLLNTPGQELLRTVPAIAVPHDFAGVQRAIQKRKQGGGRHLKEE